MPKVRFSKDFVWAPKRGVRIAYEAGKTYGIPTACHAAAAKAGSIDVNPYAAYALLPAYFDPVGGTIAGVAKDQSR